MEDKSFGLVLKLLVEDIGIDVKGLMVISNQHSVGIVLLFINLYALI